MALHLIAKSVRVRGIGSARVDRAAERRLSELPFHPGILGAVVRALQEESVIQFSQDLLEGVGR